MTRPAVTVLMPLHNGAAHLDAAVDSILAQTWSDFELLVVDDGSVDEGPRMLANRRDPRLRVARLPENQGIVAALNHGLALAQGAFIARMDADDIAESERLARQIAFLNDHPAVGVLGTDVTPFGEKPCRSWVRYHDDADLRIALLFENPLCHPTVVFRREALEQVQFRYPADYPHAEEYALWHDLSRHTQLANLPEKLLRYRIHDGQVSQRHSERQRASIDRLIHRQLDLLGVTAADRDLRIHHLLGSGFFPQPRLAAALDRWIQILVQANERTHVYPPELLKHQLAERRRDALERHRRMLAGMRFDQRLRWQLSGWLKTPPTLAPRTSDHPTP